MNVPVDRIREFEEEFLDLLELKHKDLLEELRKGILKEKEEKELEKVAREVASRYEEIE
jgi:F-type H+-transporting ATPase subunit alpha